MYETFLIFEQKYYKQCDGVAMGSALGPTFANVFMCHFENIWLQNFPTQDMWTTHFSFFVQQNM